jgi:hypothetical protein
MTSKKIKKKDDLTEINKKKFSKNNSSKKAIKNSKEISASEEPLIKIIENPEDLFIDNSIKVNNILE